MRLLAVGALLSLVAGAARADDSGWIMDDYQKGLDLGKKTGKLIQVDWTAEWCGWCKKLEKETYADPDVSKYIGENFVNVRMDKDRNGPLAEKMGVGGIPALLFIDEEGRIVGRIVGFRPPDKYMDAVKEIQAGHAKLKEAEDLVAKDGRNLQAHLDAARLWAAAESWEPVAEHLNAVIAGDPDNAKGLAAEAWTESVKARSATGDVAGTQEALDKALTFDAANKAGQNDNLMVTAGRGLQRKAPKVAKAIFEKVVVDYPREDGASESMFMIGVVLADVERDFDGAKAQFEKLAKDYPDSSWAKRVPQVLKNIESMKAKSRK